MSLHSSHKFMIPSTFVLEFLMKWRSSAFFITGVHNGMLVLERLPANMVSPILSLAEAAGVPLKFYTPLTATVNWELSGKNIVFLYFTVSFFTVVYYL